MTDLTTLPEAVSTGLEPYDSASTTVENRIALINKLAREQDVILLGGPERAYIASLERNRDLSNMVRLIDYVNQHDGRLELTRRELTAFHAEGTIDFVRKIPGHHGALMVAAREERAVDLAIAAAMTDERYLSDFCDLIGYRQEDRSLEVSAALAEVLYSIPVDAGGKLTALKNSHAQQLIKISGASDWRAKVRSMVRIRRRRDRNPDPLILGGNPIASWDEMAELEAMRRSGGDPYERIEGRFRCIDTLPPTAANQVDLESIGRQIGRLEKHNPRRFRGVHKAFEDRIIEGKTIEEIGRKKYDLMRAVLREILGRERAYEIATDYDPTDNHEEDPARSGVTRPEPILAPSLMFSPDLYLGIGRLRESLLEEALDAVKRIRILDKKPASGAERKAWDDPDRTSGTRGRSVLQRMPTGKKPSR